MISRTAVQRVGEIAANAAVHRAFQWFHLQEPQVMRWQREVTAIPAPPFGEGARADWMRRRFQDLGLADVRLDAEGNVLGIHRGASTREQPALVLCAHLDTVFPLETDLTVTEVDGRLRAPGISDNGCGLAALLAIAAVLKPGELALTTPVLFVASVGEEGEGNLRGVRHLFGERENPICAAIMLDSAGNHHAVTQALGSKRYRLTVRGPGGHAWTRPATPSAIITLARAIADLAQADLPSLPRTTLNVGTIQGGSSINSVAEEASAGIDVRSTDSEQLLLLEVRLHRAVEDAVAAANQRARQAGSEDRVSYSIEVIGERPAAALSEESGLMQALLAVDRHLGIRTERKVASTDANIPLSLGIEAITLGAGGEGGGVHTRQEWFSPVGRDLALRRILLLLLACCGTASLQPARD